MSAAPFSIPEAEPIREAERLAEELLFPDAMATDAAERVPASHLDALANAGLYGLYGPASAGGLAEDAGVALRVVETLAGGCLTTTFVWIQHHPVVRAVAASTTPGVRERWLEPLCRGRRRGGIAVAGIRPGANDMAARRVPGGWQIDGRVPWVTGWGMIDVLLVAARGPDGEVVWALVDAVDSPSLRFQPLRLVAVQASVTGTVTFEGHLVADEHVTEIEPYEDWRQHDARGLRSNGSLALGVAGRCCRLFGPGPFDRELAACRDALDRAAGHLPQVVPEPAFRAAAEVATPDQPVRAAPDPAALAVGRAAAADLALRAAAAVVVGAGSRAVLSYQHPQRLLREAAFLLVFGSRPAIKADLLERLRRAG